MINLQDVCPCKLYIGSGTLSAIRGLISSQATVLLVTSNGMTTRKVFSEVTNHLTDRRLIVKTVLSNPDLDKIDQLRNELLSANVDQIISLGGGSVMDAAKVLSVMLHPKNEKISLDDVLRKDCEFSASRLPLINIPTTSGTGAEVTPFATVWDFEHSKKKSFASPVLIPDAVILDPHCSFRSPERLTINCALDTCSHAMESLWNKNATEKSVLLATEALGILVRELPKVLSKDTLESRKELQVASLIAGLAISINRTAIAHSISYPITLHYGMPHGLACAFTLPNIARLISENNAWVKGTNLELIQKVLNLLNQLDIDKLITQYCNKDQITHLIPEMKTKGRAENFVLDHFSMESILG